MGTTHTHTPVQARGQPQVSILGSTTLFFEAGSHWDPELANYSEADRLESSCDPPVSASPVPGYQPHTTTVFLWVPKTTPGSSHLQGTFYQLTCLPAPVLRF